MYIALLPATVGVILLSWVGIRVVCFAPLMLRARLGDYRWYTVDNSVVRNDGGNLLSVDGHNGGH